MNRLDAVPGLAPGTCIFGGRGADVGAAERREQLRDDAMWMTVEGLGGAHDPDTGASMEIRSTPEIEALRVVVTMPGRAPIEFGTWLEPDKAPEMSPASPHSRLKLYVASFADIVRQRDGSYEQNSEFVRYLMAGLAAIHRRWPLYRGTITFTSTLEQHRHRNLLPTEFDFPNDEELAQIFSATPPAPGSTRIP